jgi:hypothetical protein
MQQQVVKGKETTLLRVGRGLDAGSRSSPRLRHPDRTRAMPAVLADRDQSGNSPLPVLARMLDRGVGRLQTVVVAGRRPAAGRLVR